MSDPDAPQLSTRQIIATLAEHQVSYVVVGGIAAAAQGSARVTRDLDITPQWRADNLDRLAEALTAMGARRRAEGAAPDSRTVVDFPISGQALAAFEVSAWRTRHGDLDIVSGTPTRAGTLADYDDLSRKARAGQYLRDRGLGGGPRRHHRGQEVPPPGAGPGRPPRALPATGAAPRGAASPGRVTGRLEAQVTFAANGSGSVTA